MTPRRASMLGGAGPSTASQAVASARPTCPVSIADEKPLEMGFRPELSARTWLPRLTPVELGFSDASHPLEARSAPKGMP